MNSSNGIIHDDIIISKNDFIVDSKSFKIYDEINNFILRVTGKDIDTEEIINNFNFKIGDNIYEVNNGSININLEYGNYYINDINLEDYEKVEDFYLDINKDSNFYIENNELILDLCIEFKKIPIIEVVEEPVIEEQIVSNDEVDDKKDDIKISEENNIEENIEEIKDDKKDEKIAKEEKQIEEEIKEESIEVNNAEKEEPIINEIEKDNEITNIEKLPNLGVYYEKYTIFNLIYILIIFNLYRLFIYSNC